MEVNEAWDERMDLLAINHHPSRKESFAQTHTLNGEKRQGKNEGLDRLDVSLFKD